MDRKSIILLGACFVLLVSWPFLMQKFYPPKPPPARGTNAPTAGFTASSNELAAATNLEGALTSTSAPPKSFLAPSVPERLLEATNENARYVFTSHGGGLKQIELVKFTEGVARSKKAPPGPVATLNTQAPAPVLAMLDAEATQGDGLFQLTRTATGVRAEKILPNGLRVVKEFQLSTNYLLVATVRLLNTSAQPITVPEQEWVIGTATPMGPDDIGQAEGLLWYDGARVRNEAASARPWFDNRTLGCIPGQPRSEYRNGASNVVWAAVHNQFFALAAMPSQPAQTVVMRPVALPRPASWMAHPRMQNRPSPQGYQAALAYPPVTLAPEQALERQFFFYGGPKEYRTLAQLADRFSNNLDLIMGFAGFFGFFAKALLLAMNWLHDLLGLGYGWVIILITVLIKAVFWPLTQASTRSMKRMQALQPQMKALQEKFKDDPAKMNKKLMEFMKENKVSPMGGCLPMVIQLPIFFGFYRMIQSAIELRGERFLWVQDLSKPDTLAYLPGLDWPINPLPLVMGVTMLVQSRLTPPSPGMDPTQQKIMKYMPLMFLFILYNFSAGLTLYWTVQNLLTIAQMKLTRAQDKTAVAAPFAPVPKKKR